MLAGAASESRQLGTTDLQYIAAVVLKVSHMMGVGAFGFGSPSSVALASASLAAMKAEVTLLDHCRSYFARSLQIKAAFLGST